MNPAKRSGEMDLGPESRDLPKASRTLLFPGPIAPLSHFGVTLLRHVVITGLRAAFHHLGLPLPEQAPVRIYRLRLYLDTDALRILLQSRSEGDTESDEVLGALIDPAGCSRAARSASRLRGALWFHRTRLRLGGFPAPQPASPLPIHSDPAQMWRVTGQTLTELLPTLCDAFLAEIVASTTRRRQRFRGIPTPPCLGPEAWKWVEEKNARLAFLGAPDPLVSSWENSGTVPKRDKKTISLVTKVPIHPLRGRFREHYRAALNAFRSQYEVLGESAVRRNILERQSDAYFLPFDLAGDLAAASRPAWLDDAIASNRKEYEALQSAPSPPELLSGEPEELTGSSASEEWDASPLYPMP